MLTPNPDLSPRSWGWLTGRSTPERLRLLAIVTVAVIAAAGVTSWLLSDRLVGQTELVSQSTGEVLIATQQVNASLAEADAAAVSVHLSGADGNREQRRLYELAIDRATASLELVAQLVGEDERSHQALRSIAAGATRYSGLIEAARLASIESLAGADDTLRVASALNRDQIAPEVQVIANRARLRFDDESTSSWYAVALILLAVALATLLAAQYSLQRRFRRIINLPLGLAAIVVVLMIAVAGRAFLTQRQAFDAAQTEAYEAISVSEQIQQIAYRHRAVGTASALEGRSAAAELAELEALLDPTTGGLLEQARIEADSPREAAGAVEVIERWERYLVESARTQSALDRNDPVTAEVITQGGANAAFNGFNTTVEAALLDNREQFLGQLQRASESLRWLRGSILVGTLLAAMLSWWGFAQRSGEYR